MGRERRWPRWIKKGLHIGIKRLCLPMPWWRHQIETFSALLAICEGNPLDSTHKGRGTLMFPLICAWTIGQAYNRDAGEMRRHHSHYDVTVMLSGQSSRSLRKSRNIFCREKYSLRRKSSLWEKNLLCEKKYSYYLWRKRFFAEEIYSLWNTIFAGKNCLLPW